MLDGPDYPNGLARSSQGDLLKENERLKALLLENGISWLPQSQKPKEPTKSHNMKTRKSSATLRQLPHIPMEIQLRILGYAMKCSFPIIDPFHKPRFEHLNRDERTKRKELPVRKFNLRRNDLNCVSAVQIVFFRTGYLNTKGLPITPSSHY